MRTTRVLRIEGNMEIIGVFHKDVLIRTFKRRVLMNFLNR